eukprot:TRINITY_DN243_c3_g2_i1.p1 TRINITY_DN243_c3_g2~~TRINITY_DN243_c3_g2_i1.p1  ORF type:complete len:1120 (+),score=295.18 TRINITY_DN243_c3_g2_i1:52-3411(+)
MDSRRTFVVCLVVLLLLAVVGLRELLKPPASLPPVQLQHTPTAGDDGCPTMGDLRKKVLSEKPKIHIYRDDTKGAVQRSDRIEKTGLNGATLWFTGLSGSGKSTIGKALENRMVNTHKASMYRLDGDNLRFGLSKDLDLSAASRAEAVRRAYEVSALMADAGVLSLVSLISPYREDRDAARELHKKMEIPFIEVFVDVPISEAKNRDPKGLYKKFDAGEIKGMTGIDAPYEAPLDPEVILKSHECCGQQKLANDYATCKEGATRNSMKVQDVCEEQIDACVESCVDEMVERLAEMGYTGRPADECPPKEECVCPPKEECVCPEKECPEKECPPEKVCPEAAGDCPECPAAEKCPEPKACPECKSESGSESHPKKVAGHADGYPWGTTPESLVEEDEAFWSSDAVTKLQPVPIKDVDVQWTQVIGEGWASPLKGPMRENMLVQVLHFESFVFERTGKKGGGSSGAGGPTAFGDSDAATLIGKNGERVSMPVPITVAISSHTKMLVDRAIKKAKAAGEVPKVLFVGTAGEPVAILENPEVYDFRKEEMITRSWGSWDLHHPYIKKHIVEGEEYLIGGEFSKVRRIRFRDGLDKWRLTPQELLSKFKEKNADTVYAFQTRNPTHAGHAHLMIDGRRQLLERNYTNPVLWLSPLGGWTKGDDVPLDVRVKQHQEVLDAKMLDDEWTVLSIWPSPMTYSGPTEVQWHAKSRRVVGADHFIVGRDPAGLSYSDEYAKSHGQESGDDVYHADHGRYVLQLSPGMGELGLLASGAVHYDKTDGTMKPKPAGMSSEEFKKRFLKISGSKMRKMGRNEVDICESLEAIPDDWAENPSCVPPKFMVPEGWKIMKRYYVEKSQPGKMENAVMQSKQLPFTAEGVKIVNGTKMGLDGEPLFAVYFTNKDGDTLSPWHDIPLRAEEDSNIFNMIVEIPKGSNAKFEVTKEVEHNPIMHDFKKGKPRYYTYGMAFFNNGLFPQTWEDSTVETEGRFGDNDPLDVMEVGSVSYPVGSIVPVKILGSLGLIDSGEIDHKVIAIAVDDPDAESINSIEDLNAKKGDGFTERIVDWLANYKKTDKSDPETASANEFLHDGAYVNKEDTLAVIKETNDYWKALKAGKITDDKVKDFKLE